MAAKMTEEELADILDIDPERIKEHEKKNYQGASYMELLDISLALGLEFKMAVIRVDFEEIESVKKTAERWKKRKSEKASKTTIG